MSVPLNWHFIFGMATRHSGREGLGLNPVCSRVTHMCRQRFRSGMPGFCRLLRSNRPSMIPLVLWITNLSSSYLAGARCILRLLCRIPRRVRLIAKLLACIIGGDDRAILVSCSVVCSCVRNLLTLKGPAMQLLVLVLSVFIPL